MLRVAGSAATVVLPSLRSIMDSGIWISWYDLPERGRSDYLAWLHEIHIPALLKRPGWLWAAHYASLERPSRNHTLTHVDDSSLPTGDRYILLFGAEHAHVFGDIVAGALSAALSPQDRAMLALRQGERSNVFTEAARVTGSAERSYAAGMVPAPCIQLGSYNCAWQDEEELLAWYAQWRLPAMEKLPGMVRTRKLASVAGWAKHALIYEWTSLEARNQVWSTYENEHPEMKAWSARMVPKLTHAPGSANVALRIWPA